MGPPIFSHKFRFVVENKHQFIKHTLGVKFFVSDLFDGVAFFSGALGELFFVARFPLKIEKKVLNKSCLFSLEGSRENVLKNGTLVFVPQMGGNFVILNGTPQFSLHFSIPRLKSTSVY